MNRTDLLLFEAIDTILWENWDPIGVNDVEDARDEYTSYVPHLLKLKKDGADAVKIAKHLYQLATVSMGIYNSDMYSCKTIANKIIAL